MIIIEEGEMGDNKETISSRQLKEVANMDSEQLQQHVQDLFQLKPAQIPA